MDLRKFTYNNKKSDNVEYTSHWNFCHDNKIPFVCIRKSGTKYWEIEYDIASITMMERFRIINYTDHISPLYKLYAKYSNLPYNKYDYFSGGRSGTFKVHKKDAPKLAEKIYDLLLLLNEHDQKLFDEKPFKVDKEGFNSEGYHVAGFKKKLKEISDDLLLSLFNSHKKDNPYMLQQLSLYKKEIARRNKMHKKNDKLLTTDHR